MMVLPRATYKLLLTLGNQRVQSAWLKLAEETLNLTLGCFTEKCRLKTTAGMPTLEHHKGSQRNAQNVRGESRNATITQKSPNGQKCRQKE